MTDLCIFYCIYFLFQIETWNEINIIKKEVVKSSTVVRKYQKKTHIQVRTINQLHDGPPSNIATFLPDGTIEQLKEQVWQLKLGLKVGIPVAAIVFFLLGATLCYTLMRNK